MGPDVGIKPWIENHMPELPLPMPVSVSVFCVLFAGVLTKTREGQLCIQRSPRRPIRSYLTKSDCDITTDYERGREGVKEKGKGRKRKGEGERERKWEKEKGRGRRRKGEREKGRKRKGEGEREREREKGEGEKRGRNVNWNSQWWLHSQCT